MHRSLFLILITLGPVTALTYADEINLTPKSSVREQDGIHFPQLEFADGKKTITYEPPRGWTCSGGGTQRVTLNVPDKVQADAAIGWAAQPVVFDEEGLKQVRALAPTLLARGSEDVKIVSEIANPLRMNGHEVYEVVMTCGFYGQRFKTAIYFVSLGDSQLRFTLSCQEKDFEQLQPVFQSSLFSWQWL
jgi:hypothetical protein